MIWWAFCALAFFSTFLHANGMECGILEEENQEAIRKITKICAGENEEAHTGNSTKNSEESTEKSEESNEKGHTRKGNDSRHKRTALHDLARNDSTGENPVPDNCIVQCVFRHLEMVDENGFPEHEKVTHALLKNATGRELRDFLQDMTNECFQLTEQGGNKDPCDYSSKLVSCLGNKGKANCADWPVGNLPFN